MLDYPLAPMVLAIVLGDRAEKLVRQAMIGSQGNLIVFWSNGLVSTITALEHDRAVLADDLRAWTRLRRGKSGLRPAE